MKIVFYGSDDFAFVHFKALIDSKHEICACVTQPDKAKGRGMRVVFSDIKQYALDHQIPVLQPEDLTAPDFVEELRAFGADLYIVIAYGRFLPDEVLSIPKYFSLNVHASLLPKYRGAAPINWAIINGEKETGLSIIKMNSRMDAGDIIAAKRIFIEEDETSFSLREKMKAVGPQYLLEVVNQIEENQGEMTGSPQDKSCVTFASKIRKDTGRINWGDRSENISSLVKGLLPYPAAFTSFKDKRLKILEAKVVEMDISGNDPGEILSVEKDGIIVATGNNALEILRVHMESSKPMDVRSFLLGHKILPGMRFG